MVLLLWNKCCFAWAAVNRAYSQIFYPFGLWGASKTSLCSLLIHPIQCSCNWSFPVLLLLLVVDNGPGWRRSIAFSPSSLHLLLLSSYLSLRGATGAVVVVVVPHPLTDNKAPLFAHSAELTGRAGLRPTTGSPTQRAQEASPFCPSFTLY